MNIPRSPTRTQTVELMLILAHLFPIWYFTYLPTVDGPVHLFNAIAIKDFHSPGCRYAEFFDLNIRPVPNWTTHAVLIAMIHFVSPLLAEKILVTVYVLALVWSVRSLARRLEANLIQATCVALLFAFNPSFWMGFYNYSISIALFFWAISVSLGSDDRVCIRSVGLYLFIFLAAYFSHPLGLMFSGLSAMGICVCRRQFKTTLSVAVAMIPCLILSWIYASQTGLGWAVIETRMIDIPLQTRLDLFSQDLSELWSRLFPDYQADTSLLGILWACIFEMAVVWWVFEFRRLPVGNRNCRFGLPLAIIFAITAVYFLFPDSLGEHGGVLKIRLPWVVAVLFLVAAKCPNNKIAEYLWFSSLLLALSIGLTFTNLHVSRENARIREYLAAIDLIGNQKSIFVCVDVEESALRANPLKHAASYYCLQDRNVTLANYQALVSHFCLKFRDGVEYGRGDFLRYANADRVDVVIAWECSQSTQNGLTRTGKILLQTPHLLVVDVSDRTRFENETFPSSKRKIPNSSLNRNIQTE